MYLSSCFLETWAICTILIFCFCTSFAIFDFQKTVDKDTKICYNNTVTNDPLAQMAEHMTFNHGVRSSTLRWVTKENGYRVAISVFFVGLFHESDSANFRLREFAITCDRSDCALSATLKRRFEF